MNLKSAKTLIVGCGDVGTRLFRYLTESGVSSDSIIALVRSDESAQNLIELGGQVVQYDFDNEILEEQNNISACEEIYYFVPPQLEGQQDNRSQRFIQLLTSSNTTNKRVVLISTTGVYGDCDGEVVTEKTPINPTSERSQRRADMERQWLTFAENTNSMLSILRVPGIYSFSRLPRKRIESGVPVVDPQQCGYTNRIHADDLAMICAKVMRQQEHSDIYNVSDGHPGKISQYFLDVADFLELPRPPIVSMEEGEKMISTGMMSYLKESRRIDNTKIIKQFNLKLSYPDYTEGMRF